jgi:hypothetical protein
MSESTSVANAIRALAGGLLDYSTGQTIIINGGFSLRSLLRPPKPSLQAIWPPHWIPLFSAVHVTEPVAGLPHMADVGVIGLGE